MAFAIASTFSPLADVHFARDSVMFWQALAPKSAVRRAQNTTVSAIGAPLSAGRSAHRSSDVARRSIHASADGLADGVTSRIFSSIAPDSLDIDVGTRTAGCCRRYSANPFGGANGGVEPSSSDCTHVIQSTSLSADDRDGAARGLSSCALGALETGSLLRAGSLADSISEGFPLNRISWRAFWEK